MRISCLLFSGLIAHLFVFSASSDAQTFTVDQVYTVASAAQKYAKQYPALRIANIDSAHINIRFSRMYKMVGKRELTLDLFTPKQIKPAVTIALIHGGGWRSGNKSHMYALASRLAERGYAVAAIEYRLSPEALFPAGIVDINDAIVWLKQHAVNLKISPSIIIAGGSSGGHMAALIANSKNVKAFKSGLNQDADSSVIGVVDMDGIIDLTSDAGLKYEDKDGDKHSAMARWIGNDFSSAKELWQLASPAGYINADSPAMLFIASGHERFSLGAKKAISMIQQNGRPARLVSMHNAPHTFWLFHPWIDRVVEEIDRFAQLLE
ncbi:alpha/beta hydrolase [Neptunicella marina]|uniref:Alpha/beta hydrolase n=1 Tax=Neptunicella marina TaxID=2125989 RepID=A0A8J6M386_9ALTE|nr:alpha/beta hydrolase [Neptunicella marina]MBC3766777.1 alpha/beta hydrolase [Neptunicella marina]